MNIWTILERAAALYPTRVALIDGASRRTYDDVLQRAGALAALLRANNCSAGDRVAILDQNSASFFEAYFAVAAVDVILVPLNIRLAASELAGVLRDSGARLLLAGRDLAPTVDGLAQEATRLETIHWLDETPDPAASRPRFEPRNGGAETAQLYYTSGTTGRPKGVMLTHDNVCCHALGAIAELQLRDDDIWAHVAPMFHLADAWAVFAVTWAGGCHVIQPRFDPAATLALLQRERITITNLIPTMLNLMVKHPSAPAHDYSSLRALLSGGAPIAPKLVEQLLSTFGCTYVQTYGMTETSPYLTLSLLKAPLRELPPAQQLRYVCRTGRPFATVQLKVARDDGTAVAADDSEVGEIWVRGDSVTPGYWNLPEETTAAFTDDGWLRTGDLAVIDAEGYVDIVDRRKDMIICGGENVYCVEVENVLYQHPQVLEAAVFGVPDETWGEVVAAAVVAREREALTAEALIAFCKEQLAAFKAPKVVVFYDELPKTGSGKIAKRALRNLFSATSPRRDR